MAILVTLLINYEAVKHPRKKKNRNLLKERVFINARKNALRPTRCSGRWANYRASAILPKTRNETNKPMSLENQDIKRHRPIFPFEKKTNETKLA
jgi:hypothetical protein